MKNGPMRIIHKLIQLGLDVHKTELHKFTPLHYAAIHRASVEIIQILLANGANIDSRSSVSLLYLETSTLNQNDGTLDLAYRQSMY